MRTRCRFTGVLYALLFGVLCAFSVSGQVSSQNYVRSAVMTATTKSNPALDCDLARVTIDYYDGLGRPIQQVRQGAGGNAFDLHTITEYDFYGRPYKTWLPVESNGTNGAYLDPDELMSSAQSFYNDTRPYTETEYARIPETREEIIYGPGKAWHDKGKSAKRFHGFNYYGDSTYGCPRFDVSSGGVLVLNDEYDDGMLRYEEQIDEDDTWIIRFFDRDNRLVHERRWSQNKSLDTHYVYNAIGQLSYVIPPKAVSHFLEDGDSICSNEIVSKLCHYYGYDQYNRMTEHRRPGAETEYYVYDALDNVVMSQDGNLRKENKWRVTKLDHRYRKAVEGIATLPGETRASLQECWGNDLAIETVHPAYAGMDELFYSDTCGIAGFEPKVAYFYDNYNVWDNVCPDNLPTDSDYPAGMTDGMGMLTGKAVWEDWYVVLSAYTYDDRRRLILDCEYSFSDLYSIHTFHKYSFAGDLLKKKTVYNNNDLCLTYRSEYTYEYDYWGNLLSTYHKINDEPRRLLYFNTYDEVNRLTRKNIYHNGTPNHYQTSYDYNIRSQITELNSPKFSQWLHYEDSITGSTPRWAGSPSAMSFTSVSESGGLDTCTVTYRYDEFDRLVSVTSKGGTGDPLRTFSENFFYDDNGNPEIIIRGNPGGDMVQYISLTYEGNKISALNESKPIEGRYPDIPSITKGDYENGWSYDANGNRTADPSRGITSITYNHLNQPLKFTFDDGSYIEHRYRSDGTLYERFERERVISTVNGTASTTATYKSSGFTKVGDVILKSTIPTMMYIEGGYITLNPLGSTNTQTSYNYYVYDNQGSVRAVLNASGELTQATDYSAYGVPSSRYAGTSTNNHLHLGLEWQPMKGVSGYYNNARFRDALLAGTFYQQDPLAEKYHPFSPYHYGANNPLLNMDFNGMDWYSYNTTHLENGETINKTEYAYTDYTSQEDLTNAGINGSYLGKAVVVFNGSMDEKLGEGQNLYGEGAVLADVTVYGPNGKDDIKNYKGFTMSSDATKFGVVADGVYDVNRVERKGPYNSEWTINNRSKVPAMNDYNPAYPNRNPGYLDGVFIHRSNNNGWAGVSNDGRTAVSKGCLLITPKHWHSFSKQLSSVNRFKLILDRK